MTQSPAPLSLLWQDGKPPLTDARIGGKALGLARLALAGARVPPWFVIPTESFEAHLGRDRAQERLQRVLDGLVEKANIAALEAATSQAAKIVEELPLEGEWSRIVEAGLARLGPGPYAVRSSMVGEDSASRSFAGQLDTFLYQRTAEDVLRAVRRCWISAFGARALSYRLRTEAKLQLPRIGVIVQRMIAGEVSGVVFTTHPLTHRQDQLLISACWGLGEGLVSGQCDADEFVCSSDGRLLSSQIADKESQVVEDPSRPGTRQVEVPSERRQASCLSADRLRELCEQASRVATALGRPQDIEWTISEDTLFLLQARPITSKPGGARVIWDNSNIQESYCGVTTPLTFSFAAAAYASSHEQLLRALGVSKSVIDAHRPQMRNLLGLVKGRVYYNINNWYRMLLVLPSFGRNKTDLEHMLGLDPPVDFIEDQHLSWTQKLRRLPGMVWVGVRLITRFASLDSALDRFAAGFEDTFSKR